MGGGTVMADVWSFGLFAAAAVLVVVGVVLAARPAQRRGSWLIVAGVLAALLVAGVADAAVGGLVVVMGSLVAGCVVAATLDRAGRLAESGRLHVVLLTSWAVSCAVSTVSLRGVTAESLWGSGWLHQTVLAVATVIAVGCAAMGAALVVRGSAAKPATLTVRLAVLLSVVAASGVTTAVVVAQTAWWVMAVASAVAATVAAVWVWTGKVAPHTWVVSAGAALAVVSVACGVALGSVVVVALAALAAGMCLAVRTRQHTPHVLAGQRPSVRRPVVSAEDAAVLLANARRVVLVPGCDVAVDGGLAQVSGVVQVLGRRGVDVKVAAHPGAGRLPGLMATLLAESSVGQDRLVLDPVEADQHLAGCDVAVLVGPGEMALRAPQDALSAQGCDVLAARSVMVVAEGEEWGPHRVDAAGVASCTVVRANPVDAMARMRRCLVS